MTPPLERLASKADPNIRMMSLDPGQTTGWALWEGTERIELGQLTPSAVEVFLEDYDIHQIVMENYRIYQGKEKVQRNLYTPRLIGRIEAYAELHHIRIAKQMAAVAKRFCNDQKLKDWGLWVPGQRHAMDATRHGAYWLIFQKDEVTASA